MSSNKTVSIVIVALIHLALGYALVTGLAYNVIKQAAKDLKTFDVEEEPPPPEDKPPPPEKQPDVPPPPQMVAPPPLVRMESPAPQMQTSPIISPVIITPRAAPAPPAPPAPPPQPVRVEPARAKANLSSYVSNDDYPDSAIRGGEQGTTGFRLTVGADGRVANCEVTRSSGSSSLDSTTCRLMRSRARFTPATDSSGSKTSDTVTATIRWVLPEE